MYGYAIHGLPSAGAAICSALGALRTQAFGFAAATAAKRAQSAPIRARCVGDGEAEPVAQRDLEQREQVRRAVQARADVRVVLPARALAHHAVGRAPGELRALRACRPPAAAGARSARTRRP